MKNLLGYFQDRKAATAVEFALVAVPMIYLLIGILEIAIFFATNSVIHGASSEAGRLIRTGQLQQGAADPEEVFNDTLCQQADFMIDCSRLQYEVITLGGGFASFADAAAEYDEDGNFSPRPFNAGGVSDVVLVRSVYPYQFLTPMISYLIAGSEDGVKTIMSTIVFQTEPYDFESGGGE